MTKLALCNFILCCTAVFIGNASAADCVNPTCLSEPFTYADGSLGGSGSWTGSNTGAVEVVSNEVKISGGTSNTASLTLGAPCLPTGGIIAVSYRGRFGSGASSFLYNIYLTGSNNVDLFRFQGRPDLVRIRNAVNNVSDGALITTPGF